MKPVEVEGSPGFLASFTTAEKAASFMAAKGEAPWENRLVTRSTLSQLVKDFRAAGLAGVIIDAGPGADAGQRVTLEELDSMA